MLDGGVILRWSKILGHSSVVIRLKTYAHLAPGRVGVGHHNVRLAVPGEAAVYELRRDESGRIVGRETITIAC